MPTSRFDKFLPIAGIIAGLLFAFVGFNPEPPGVDAGAAERIQWFNDHDVMETLVGFAAGYFAVVMLFFATAIRKALRSGESGESTYSTAALAGGIVVAVAAVSNGLLHLTAVQAADKNQEAVLTTVAFLADYSWMPIIVGLGVMYLATGFGGLRTLALPKWLAIATVVLGFAAIAGPAGFAAYLLTPLWLIVTGVVLTRRLGANAPAGMTSKAPSYAA